MNIFGSSTDDNQPETDDKERFADKEALNRYRDRPVFQTWRSVSLTEKDRLKFVDLENQESSWVEMDYGFVKELEDCR